MEGFLLKQVLHVLQASIVNSTAEHAQRVAQLQAAAKRQERLAEERLQRAEQQIMSMAQARRELDNKVSLACTERQTVGLQVELCRAAVTK